MRKGPNVCPRECRLTCPEWKAFEEEKQKAYAAKAISISSYPDSSRKKSCARKNAREKMRRH